jgi:hypothetical protein
MNKVIVSKEPGHKTVDRNIIRIKNEIERT